MLKRAPTKPIKIAAAMKLLGYNSRTTMLELVRRQGWKHWRNNDAANSPIFLFEADVLNFREQRETK